MWSCAFSNTRRVRLTVKLHTNEQGIPMALSHIKMWNYNKTLNVSVLIDDSAPVKDWNQCTVQMIMPCDMDRAL